MKFKRKIRQPKKAKKVTLARIREIVKEELSALFRPDMDYPTLQDLRKDLPKLLSDKPHHDGGTSIHAPFVYEREEKTMYFPPTTIKPVPPPPRVSAKLANLPPLPLPDEYEVDEGENIK